MEGTLLKSSFLALLWVPLMASAAAAQPVTGFYVQGDAGLALPQQQSMSISPASPTSAAESANAAINGGTGAAQTGGVGVGLGQGFRVEVQGMHDFTPGSGTVR